MIIIDTLFLNDYNERRNLAEGGEYDGETA